MERVEAFVPPRCSVLYEALGHVFLGGVDHTSFCHPNWAQVSTREDLGNITTTMWEIQRCSDFTGNSSLKSKHREGLFGICFCNCLWKS